MSTGNAGPVTASVAVRWFLAGDVGRSALVRCDTGQEADTVADIVTAVRAARRTRIVVAAPKRSGVLDAAIRLGEALGPDDRGLPQVGMGRIGTTHPDGVGKLHASVPVRPSVVAVKTLTAAVFGAPACDLMIVTGIHPMSVADVESAARHAARLMVLCPPGVLECPEPAAHENRNGPCDTPAPVLR